MYNICVTVETMPREQTAFRLDQDLMNGLRAVKERDGVPISEQVRRAVRVWLEAKGAMPTKAMRAKARMRSC